MSLLFFLFETLTARLSIGFASLPIKGNETNQVHQKSYSHGEEGIPQSL